MTLKGEDTLAGLFAIVGDEGDIYHRSCRKDYHRYGM